MIETPRGNRLHIGIFGRRNSGKSTLINAITNQNIALVSDVAGTTTDPVYKAMEIKPLGAIMLIDTAGYDDDGELGLLRVGATQKALEKTDVAVLVIADDLEIEKDKQWIAKFDKLKIPYIVVYNPNNDNIKIDISDLLGREVLEVNAKNGANIDKLTEFLTRITPEDFEVKSITGDFVKCDDIVMLIMPQDGSAPKGRLILPQVQTIRDLLDNKCITVCVTPDKMAHALSMLKSPPKMIITDSQAFDIVYGLTPKESLLTSFSILFAAYKGDVDVFANGAQKIDSLDAKSKVLIAEACTHAPATEDIGRVKIPNMLNKKYGVTDIEIVSGANFPQDLTNYDLIIHCGACMFNRKLVLNRIFQAQEQGVPITNYGMAIAQIQGILNRVKHK